ncbi:hypothetical protein ACJZ2D_009330 [Fusarium nematophilum]
MTTVKGPLCTRTTLVNDFKNLGVLSGETLLLHSSLSSIGWVCGGAEVVVQALLDVLGPTGTLVVPTHSGDNSDPSKWESPPVPQEWWQVIRESTPAYNPLTTRTRGMGVIAETLRTWPGAIRSAHPQTSFAAVGFHAHTITAGHALDCLLGEQSPLARLEHVQARVLLLGVGFDVCTAFHLAEYRTSSRLVSNSFAAMNQGRREWVTVQDVDLSDEGFEELGLGFERDEDVVKGMVGGADARLFKLEPAVMYATLWFRKHRKGPSSE